MTKFFASPDMNPFRGLFAQDALRFHLGLIGPGNRNDQLNDSNSQCSYRGALKPIARAAQDTIDEPERSESIAIVLTHIGRLFDRNIFHDRPPAVSFFDHARTERAVTEIRRGVALVNVESKAPACVGANTGRYSGIAAGASCNYGPIPIPNQTAIRKAITANIAKAIRRIEILVGSALRASNSNPQSLRSVVAATCASILSTRPSLAGADRALV